MEPIDFKKNIAVKQQQIQTYPNLTLKTVLTFYAIIVVNLKNYIIIVILS